MATNNLQSQLERIQIARDAIKASLVNKGQNPDDNIETYAIQIDNIITREDAEIITKEGVKLFETEEQMQADSTAKDGDYAVVYREEINNWDGASQVQNFIFPKEVILSSVGEGYCYGYGSSASSYIDIDGSISSTGASFRIYGDDMKYIEYTSEDGLTYTRTDSYEEIIVISEEPLTIRMYEWEDICGNFMKTKGNTFEGLYRYGIYSNKEYVNFIPVTGLTAGEDNTPIWDGSVSQSYEVAAIRQVVANAANNSIISYMTHFFLDENNDLCFMHHFDTSGNSSSNIPHGVVKVGDIFKVGSKNSTPIKVFKVTNLETGEYELKGTYNYTSTGSTTYDKYIYDIQTNSTYLGFYATSDRIYFQLFGTMEDINGTIYPIYLQEFKYTIAPTQLTLSNSGQLLPGVMAYGNNGVITGDDSIFTNLDADQIEAAWFQNAGTDLQYKVSTTSKTQELKAIRTTLAPNYSLENCSTAACCALQTEQSSHNIYAVEPIEEGFKVCRHTAGTIQFKKLDYTLQEISSIEVNETNMRLLSGHYVNDKFYAVVHEATSNTASGPVKFYVFDTETGTIEYKSNALITDSYISGQLAVDEITNYVYICLQCTSNNRYHYAFRINLTDYTSTQLYKASSISTNGGLAYSKHYIAMMVAGTVYTVMKGSSTIKTLCTGGNSNYFVSLTETDEYAYYLDNSKKLYRFNIGSETAQLLASDVSASYRFQTLKINNQWYFGFDSSVYEDYTKTKLAYILSPIYNTSAKALNNVYPYIITKDNRIYLYSINAGYIYLFIGFNYTYEPNLIACQTDLDVIPIYHDGNYMYFLSAAWIKPNTWGQE